MLGAEKVLVEGWCQQFPGHSMGDIRFGPDGALWFTEVNGNKIGRITMAGVVRGGEPDGARAGCDERAAAVAAVRVPVHQRPQRHSLVRC